MFPPEFFNMNHLYHLYPFVFVPVKSHKDSMKTSMNQQALADPSHGFCQESFKRMHELRAEKLRAEVEVAKGVTSSGVAVGYRRLTTNDGDVTKETC